MRQALLGCICGGLIMSSPAKAADAQNVFIAQHGAARTEDQAHDAKLHMLNDDELGDYRGGETLVSGNQSLTATTSDNVLNGNYTSGAVTFSDRTLSNFNGLGNFAINTGAQVSLQSAMNLTVNVGQ